MTGRPMNPQAWERTKKERAQFIFERFEEFATGYRCLFLIQRHKEGGETNNSKLIKKITKNPEEYLKALTELTNERMESDLPLRIYAAVNERDMKKAIRKFKHEQLDAEDYSEEQLFNFYQDIRNRFIGCLMQPGQKKTSYFIFDCDNDEGRDVYGEALAVIPNEHIVKTYSTKNGWHIVTQAFNYTTLVLPKNVEIQKDGLLLLDF